jgi:rhodanese-related sulfurtransferase
MVTELSPQACAQKMASDPQTVLLDVREAWERAIVSLPTGVAIPMGQIPERLTELSRDTPIIVMCHGGVRSRRVAEYLVAHDFTQIFNMTDGIAGWQRDVDSSLATY